MAELMTPSNPHWKEFINRLAGPEGCSPATKCNGTGQRPFARAILEKMGNIDIEATFKYFDDRLGYCDCQILSEVSEL